MTVILASQSPRRKELLQRVVPQFDIVPADIDEEVKPCMTPTEYVLEMATQKARFIAKTHPEALIIGCDTIVTIDNQVLGKPVSRADGFRMLKALSGREHHVYTSVTLIEGDQEASVTVPSKVTFYELTDEEINTYLDTEEYADKAGAYGIQGQGALLIKSIEGDYYTIMGLPIARLSRMLKSFQA